MYNKEKKGFTLVELLAVIVVLGILALITTPLVLNTIDVAREKSALATANNYLSSLENEFVKKQILNLSTIEKGEYKVLTDGKYQIGEEIGSISMKGSLPKSGIFCVNSNLNIKKYSIVIDDYVVSNITGEQEIEKGTKVRVIF